MWEECRKLTFRELIEACRKEGVSPIISDGYYDDDEFDLYGDDDADCFCE